MISKWQMSLDTDKTKQRKWFFRLGASPVGSQGQMPSCYGELDHGWLTRNRGLVLSGAGCFPEILGQHFNDICMQQESRRKLPVLSQVAVVHKGGQGVSFLSQRGHPGSCLPATHTFVSCISLSWQLTSSQDSKEKGASFSFGQETIVA